jgi:DNA-3-methyladenine glycosylase
MGNKLPRDFYVQNDAIEVAQRLIGKEIFTSINGEVTSGIITETEAYMGEIDKACHAYGGKRTDRTEVLFDKGGKAYVYLVYGLHYLLNTTVGEKGNPECVLIRSIYPQEGLEIMQWRRFGSGKPEEDEEKIANGPAKLTQALGIDKNLYGKSLLSRRIWIEERLDIPSEHIISSPRVGIDYAEEFKGKDWRYVVEPSKIQELI